MGTCPCTRCATGCWATLLAARYANRGQVTTPGVGDPTRSWQDPALGVYQDTQQDDRGHSTESPAQIPKRGWRDIALRSKEGIQKGNVSIIAGGTAFFLLLGLVPGLAAVISIYGLIANPSDVEAHLASLAEGMPSDARTILAGQMTRIASLCLCPRDGS
jgi:hypothetical protein